MQVLLDMLLAAAVLAVLAFIYSWFTHERPVVRQAQARVVNLAEERRRRASSRLTRSNRLGKR